MYFANTKDLQEASGFFCNNYNSNKKLNLGVLKNSTKM